MIKFSIFTAKIIYIILLTINDLQTKWKKIEKTFDNIDNIVYIHTRKRELYEKPEKTNSKKSWDAKIPNESKWAKIK